VRIMHNVMADNAYTNLNISRTKQASAAEKLNSGYRINRAADDAAGLAISEKMRGQIRGLGRAILNGQDGISMLQIADGGMQGITDALHRQRELLIQALNDTNDKLDKQAIKMELTQLYDEATATAEETNFNMIRLLDVPGAPDGPGTALWIQAGANRDDGMWVDRYNCTMNALLGIASIEVEPHNVAEDALEAIDKAVNQISLYRGRAGAQYNRLEYKLSNLSSAQENLQAAESRIRDADMAKEMATFVKESVLVEAGTATLAQANALPEKCLELMG